MSQLKLCPDPVAATVISLPASNDPQYPRGEPEAILERKLVKRGNLPATKVLVKWKHFPKEMATWEFYYDVQKKFPNFHP